MIDPYKVGKSGVNPYGASRPELDLRAELDELLEGDRKGTWMMFRRVRMSDKGLPVKHPDVYSNRNGEMSRDILSSGSTNNGNLYDDHIVLGFMNHSQAYSITNRFKSQGESMVDYRTVYFKYNFLTEVANDPIAIPTVLDKIVRLKQDLEGNLISPSQVIERYDILSVDPYRLDSLGRIEYYRIRVISVVDESFQL